MRLVSLSDDVSGSSHVAVELHGQTSLIRTLVEGGYVPAPRNPGVLADLHSFIADEPEWRDEAIDAIRRLDARAFVATGRIVGHPDVTSMRMLAPLPRPRKNVFCVGLNYVDHAREGAKVVQRREQVPTHPVFFSKPATTVIGPGADILVDSSVTSELDYEVELAVILGRAGRDIDRHEAGEFVFGFTIVNDVSARDLQRRHGQWFKGKSLDCSLPMGPGVVPAADMRDLQSRAIRLRLNGVVMQEARLADMIFDVPTLIESLSAGLTLEAGDVIATGTPAGVGFARTPPRFLTPGDLVECEIDGLGVLRNRVVAAG